MRNGSLTVYLSLILSLILSFILTMVEGARIHTIRMEGECAVDIAMNSILAEYHRELLEQYDLFFVDQSYGTADAKIENTAEHLRSYLEHNFRSSEKGFRWSGSRDWLGLSVDKALVKDLSLASDQNGAVIQRQILEYMKDTTIEGKIADFMDRLSVMDSLEFEERDISSERDEIQTQIESIELPTTIDDSGTEREISLDNPADAVNVSRGSFILGMVLGDTSSVSGAVIRPEEYISSRPNRLAGIGLPLSEDVSSSLTDRYLLNQYFAEKCGRYGSEMDKSLLKYQLEYLVIGKESDLENLEGVAKRLLLWREIANLVYLFSDTAKCLEAEVLAYSLSAVLMVPALAEPVKYSILFAWAYIESLCDVRSLLEGGKVPLIKTSSDWVTGIEGITNFSGRASDSTKAERGLDYLDYLQIMLFGKEDQEKIMRFMDLAEMDIRQTPGNQYFRMDGCFDSYTAEITVSSRFGYQFDQEKTYGYNMN